MPSTPPAVRFLLCSTLLIATATAQQPENASAEPAERIEVPRLWTEEALREWALPLAGLGVPPAFVDPDTYYAAPVENLRSYPVYHPAHEPPGYREQLVQRGPQPLIEPEQLHSKADWLAAGQRVFEQIDVHQVRTDDPVVIAHYTDAEAVDKYRDAQHDVVNDDGILMDFRWVVDHDGKLKLSLPGCAGCHTRHLTDERFLRGAPSNYDLSFSPAVDRLLQPLREIPGMSPQQALYAGFGVPWREDDEHQKFLAMTPPQIGELFGQETGSPPGETFDRASGSPFYTTRIADLRGVRHRRYLDATATHHNRGPEDLARYAILVAFADVAAFGPHRMIPKATFEQELRRPSDAAMYAMALYLYSLDVPPSPHAEDEQTRRGEQIFAEEGCKKCHSPPHYTNNQLVAVPGFTPPTDDPHTARLAISDRTVDTDPGLALKTRKGTGYYKVPSLRGLWYRGLLEHSGSVKTLEDWFDERRLEPDYVPTGWRGPGVEQRAVPGHEFGLDLEPADKAALIAFLRTL